VTPAKAIILTQPPEKSSPDLESVTIPGFFIIVQNIPAEFQRQWQSIKTGSRLFSGSPFYFEGVAKQGMRPSITQFSATRWSRFIQ
jgi:hypothetical protein